jgi:hypothetical protein
MKSCEVCVRGADRICSEQSLNFNAKGKLLGRLLDSTGARAYDGFGSADLIMRNFVRWLLCLAARLTLVEIFSEYRGLSLIWFPGSD